MAKPQRTQFTDNIKEVCLACFDEFLDEQFLNSGRSKIYDFLDEGNYINLSAKEKNEYFEQARRVLPLNKC